MRYLKLGNSSIEVSVVGLGTWAVGGGEWWGNSDENSSIRAIDAAMENGINLIDTAPAYGFGYSEEVVGKAIQGKRDKVVLSTKCGLWWHGPEGELFFQQGDKVVNRCLKAKIIRKELELSLKRLGTDYIDIYHTHWQDPTTPVEETAQCLKELQDEGKIRAIAVSNATVEDCKAYMAKCSLAANQLKYSMLDRGIEDSMAQFCIENNIGILAYSPLEQGLLTGRIGMDAKFSETEYRNAIPWYKPANRARVLELLKGFDCLQKKYNCTVGQLVIAWTCQQTAIASVLCGARRPENVIENVVAGDIILEDADLLTMRKAVEELKLAEV